MELNLGGSDYLQYTSVYMKSTKCCYLKSKGKQFEHKLNGKYEREDNVQHVQCISVGLWLAIELCEEEEEELESQL